MRETKASPGYVLPHGLADLFFEAAAAKDQIESTLTGTFSRWGYTRIVLPTFEYADCLATEASPRSVDQMYRFFDHDGQAVALRPDMTVPTARVVGTRLYDQTLPLRFYYIGSVFRHVETQAGHRREFTQAGVEMIGADTAEADAEIIALSVAALKAMSVDDFQINLGNVAYLRGILNDASGENGVLQRLERAIERKNPVALERYLAEMTLPDDARVAIRALPTLCGKDDVLEEADRLTGNVAARQAIARLRQVYHLLRIKGVSEHVILDLGEVRSMGYYTGVTYHGYAAGLGFPLCSGGRYDRLLSHFGADLPAIGFALGVERALLVVRPQVDIAPDLVMPSCGHFTCRAIAQEARALGLRTEVDVMGRTGDDLVVYARAKKAHRVLCCSDGEHYRLIDECGEHEVNSSRIREEMPTWVR